MLLSSLNPQRRVATLMMVVGFVVALVSPRVARAFQGFLCAGIEVEVLEQTVDRTVLRIDWPGDSIPLTGAYDFAVAVPSDGPIEASILQIEETPVVPPLDIPEVQLFEFLGPLKARELWIRELRVYPVYATASGVQVRVDNVVLELRHPAPAAMASAARLSAALPSWDRSADLYRGVVVNPGVAARLDATAHALRRAGETAEVEDTFARSPRWLRLEVEETGLYGIDYASLRAKMGPAVDLLDPASLRLFGAVDRLQPDLPQNPEASWVAGAGLVERPILVEDQGGGFGAGDRIVAFLPGAEGWADEFDPAADPLLFEDHPYAERIAYWLTWDEVGGEAGDFPSPPRRVQVEAAAPSGSAGVTRLHGRTRSHLEENLVPSFGVFRDNWAWRSLVPDGGQASFRFDLQGVVPDSNAWLHTQAHAVRLGSFVNTFAAVYSMNGTELDRFTWTSNAQHSIVTAPVMYRRGGVPVQEGSNLLLVEHESGRDTRGRSPQWTMDSFDLTWRRKLALDDRGELRFHVPSREAVSARWRFQMLQPAGGLSGVLVWDVTDPWQPVQLDPGSGRVSDSFVEFERPLSNGQVARFHANDPGRLRTPARIEQRRPRLLRQEVGPQGGDAGWDMIVLHPEVLRGPAEDLRDMRRNDLAGMAGARVTAVDLQDVYDQFGHGTKDPAAIRNYLKFVYERDQRLLYVVLLGDANRDAKGVLPVTDEDLCPTHVSTWWPSGVDTGTYPFADDDWFVRFQDPTVMRQEVGIELPDVAIGRLPATSVTEAERLVRRIREYEQNPPGGPWRNTVLLAADDEYAAANDSWSESFHIGEAECIAERVFPPVLDIDKLYLTEFSQPGAGRSKPGARQRMTRDWTEGRLIVHYIGHGSPEQMADENLFRIEDVASLQNGSRLPLFLAFSCDVSIFDDPTKTSMAEAMVLRENGGAIASIAATQVTYVSQNNDLTEAFYSQLFLEQGELQKPTERLTRSTPIGLALLQSKWRGPDLLPGQTRLSNDAKYVLLGDPSLRLVSPEQEVTLSGDLSDSITAGQQVSIGGAVAGGARGEWFVQARESAKPVRYFMIRPPAGAGDMPDTLGTIDYVLEGAIFYEGRGDYSGGEFTAQLRTPTVMRFGSAGRVRVLMEDAGEQFVGFAENLEVKSGMVDSDDRTGPAIQLGFENEARVVQPGATLSAALEDSSGINVLGTLPANSILLEFDGGGIAVDVTDRFELDANSFTRGSLDFTLPEDITMGPHALTITAADMVGNVATETLAFEVAPLGRVELGSHAAFPNPFKISTRFVIEVLAPPGMSVPLGIEIYTLRGQRLRTLSGEIRGSGGAVIEWDGRDAFGDDIANGTYLYVVRAQLPTHPARTESATGRIVLMR